MSNPVMNRRSFLAPWKSSTKGSSRTTAQPLSTGLEPFVPDANNPWDAYRAGHLLRRTMMSPTWADIQSLVALGDPGKAVDALLSATSTPAPPSCADNVTESLDPIRSNQLLISQRVATWVGDAGTLRNWQANLQLNATASIQEKMVYFWSGHFTTEFFLGENTVVVAPLLYRQNKLFRDHFLGNFKDLVNGITLDGAMLVYLGGDQNNVKAPNENFARELMELFTCGIGWYSEGDVQMAARILTGWHIAQYTDKGAPNGYFKPYFIPADHDTGAKVYLNQSFPAIDASTNTEFLVQKNEIEKLVDVLFTVNGSAIATFICKKLYRFFIYSNAAAVDNAVVAAMAKIFTDNNFEIKPVVSALLKSAHFFDNANIGCQIKTPAEYVIGMARQLAPKYPIDANMTADGQQFFQPPNVSGWPGWHDWITTSTYPTRGTEANTVIASMDDATATSFYKQFPNYTDANALAIAINQLLLPRPLSTSRQAMFVSKLVAGGMSYDWPSIVSSTPATAARNLRDLLTYIASLPDFELC